MDERHRLPENHTSNIEGRLLEVHDVLALESL